MITPVNNHLLIEPVEHDSFIASERSSYEEIGVVIDFDEKAFNVYQFPQKGKSIVYFDSWLAAKFPGKEPNTFLWMVKWEDIRAIEYEPVSE